MNKMYEALKTALAAEQPVAVATIIAGTGLGNKLLVYADGTTLGELSKPLEQGEIVKHALVMLERAENGTRSYATTAGEIEVFIESYPPPPTLLIVGAVHIAIALVSYAKLLGFRTVVFDARQTFATPERFAHADTLVVGWPDEVLPAYLNQNSYVVLLTHDPKFDDPTLMVAFASGVRYIGALGSSKTHAQRVARLHAALVSAEQIERIHAPIGLPIGGRSPEEIALSIMAQIVAVKNGKSAHPG